MHILYFDPSGYLIFTTKAFEEIGIAIQSVKRSYDDIQKFSSLIKFEKFYPFHDAEEANDNLQYINKENSIPPTMRKVLTSYGRKHIQNLGIEFSNIADALKETYDIKVTSNALVIEIIRCIRYHIPSILKENHDELFRKAVISKFNSDIRISSSDGKISVIYHTLKNIESTILPKTAKLRQLIQPFFPELKSTSLISNVDFPKFVSIYFDDTIINKWAECKKVLGSVKVVPIQKAMKSTIGREITKLDSNLIKECADELNKTIDDYNKSKSIAYNITKAQAPNLTTYLELVANMNSEYDVNLCAMEIISNAGSLKKLAEKCSTAIHTQNKNNDSLLKRTKVTNCPRSSAEKLRSVHLKTLADNCALAARKDYFQAQDDVETKDDSFGRTCFERHELRIKTYANNKALEFGVKDKSEIIERTKKFKLKRKEKKKLWRQRKEGKQRDILYDGLMDVDMED